MSEEIVKIQEVLAAFDKVPIIECGDCKLDVPPFSLERDLSYRLFRNIKEGNVVVRPCIGHLNNYIESYLFEEVEV